jgi:hypothetical protein
MRPRVVRVWDQRADVTPFNGEISRAGARSGRAQALLDGKNAAEGR